MEINMNHEIVVPPVGESVSEVEVGRWLYKSGDFVEKGLPLVELETDKVNIEVHSEHSGTIHIDKEVGTKVKVGEMLGSLSEAKGPSNKKETSPFTSNDSEPTKSDTYTSTHLSPAVLRLVTENAIDPQKITGSGKDGRILKSDILQTLKDTQKATKPPFPSVTKDQRRVKMSLLRRKISERLVSSMQNTAMLTTFNEVDMSAIISMRNEQKDSFVKKHGVSLGFMGFFVKASIFALEQYEIINSFVDGEDIVYNQKRNIGVAVSTDKGLIVPVLHSCENYSLAEIEVKIQELAEKARSGQIGIEELSSGTFTISNGGVFGSLLSTPILNPPQSAILGMHKIEQRPVAREGQVVVRPMMYLALSYDHRIIDGKEAVGFLVKVKELLEDPSRMLLGV